MNVFKCSPSYKYSSQLPTPVVYITRLKFTLDSKDIRRYGWEITYHIEYTRTRRLWLFCCSHFELKSLKMDIAESILVSKIVVIEGDIPIKSLTIWPPVWQLGKKCPLSALGKLVSLKLWYSNSKDTPLQRYGGIAKEKLINFASYLSHNCLFIKSQSIWFIFKL